jgi:hypothetical protein
MDSTLIILFESFHEDIASYFGWMPLVVKTTLNISYSQLTNVSEARNYLLRRHIPLHFDFLDAWPEILYYIYSPGMPLMTSRTPCIRSIRSHIWHYFLFSCVWDLESLHRLKDLFSSLLRIAPSFWRRCLTTSTRPSPYSPYCTARWKGVIPEPSRSSKAFSLTCLIKFEAPWAWDPSQRPMLSKSWKIIPLPLIGSRASSTHWRSEQLFIG